MMLRKYITADGKYNNQMWLGKVSENAKIVLTDYVDDISRIYNNYECSYNKDIEQTLDDGTILKLRQTFDDIIYGIFLHTDAEKVDRLMISDETMRLFCMREFVKDIELSLFEFEKLLLSNGIKPLKNKKDFEKGLSVAIKEDERGLKRNITSYWSHLYGENADEKEAIEKTLKNKTSEELQIFACALLFWMKISDGSATQENMRDVVFQPTSSDWGNFSRAKEFANNLKDPGVGSTVNFNDRHDVAIVKIIEHIENSFQITQPQIIKAKGIELIKDESIDKWRVFSFGGYVDPFLDR
jgi:hypothetical protein